MSDKKITIETYLDEMSKALRIQHNTFITEIDKKVCIYYVENNQCFVREYGSLIQSVEDLLSDDLFCETMICYYLMDKAADHITDILHWYKESYWDINSIVFSLRDIIDCNYYL